MTSCVPPECVGGGKPLLEEVLIDERSQITAVAICVVFLLILLAGLIGNSLLIVYFATPGTK